MGRNATKRYVDGIQISPAMDPLVIGDWGDKRPTREQILAVVSILKDAGISCCFVQEFGLIYYGAARVLNNRTLCVPDEQHTRAVDLFKSHSGVLMPCEPSPLSSPNSRNHIYPRFKAVGRTDFWLLLPASECHVVCIPENIEWSRGGLPYLKLPVYAQSVLDTKRLVDLEDLVDGMDLSSEWGENNLDLEGVTDTEWLENYRKAIRDDGAEEMFNFIDPKPVSRRELWDKTANNRQKRMGWKYPTEIYATKYRRHGSKDPRDLDRDGL